MHVLACASMCWHVHACMSWKGQHRWSEHKGSTRVLKFPLALHEHKGGVVPLGCFHGTQVKGAAASLGCLFSGMTQSL